VIHEAWQERAVTSIVGAQLDAIEMLGALVSIVRGRNEPHWCAVLDRQRRIAQSIRDQYVGREEIRKRQCRSIAVLAAQYDEPKLANARRVRHDQFFEYILETKTAPLDGAMSPAGRAVKIRRERHSREHRKLGCGQHDGSLERAGNFQTDIAAFQRSPRERNDTESRKFRDRALTGREQGMICQGVFLGSVWIEPA
jgi:hypothetical protein